MWIAVGRYGQRLGTGKKIILGAVAAGFCLAGLRSCQTEKTMRQSAYSVWGRELEGEVCLEFLPLLSMAEESIHGTYWLLQEQVDSLLPAYGYLIAGMEEEQSCSREEEKVLRLPDEEGTEGGTWGQISRGQQNQDGASGTEGGGQGNDSRVYGTEGDGQKNPGGAYGTEGDGQENDSAASGTESDGQKNPGGTYGMEDGGQQAAHAGVTEDGRGEGDEDREEPVPWELLQAENQAALSRMEQEQQEAFVPHARQTTVELEPLSRYETLVQQFYTVDANTMAGSELLNAGSFLEKDMTVEKESQNPQILIYHTHSQETFADSTPGETSDTIMGIGEYLTEILRDTYGYQVLHHTGQYDVESRNDAYSLALPAIKKVLEENPSIEVVIDLHRDEMAEGTRLVTEVDGRPTARFMFFNGLSRTRKTGNISYLYNENLENNLAFSFQMQLKAMEYYPGLTRKIYLKGYRYNMHLCPRYLLVELGAQNNTLEEAKNACGPLAHLLDMVLMGEE